MSDVAAPPGGVAVPVPWAVKQTAVSGAVPNGQSTNVVRSRMVAWNGTINNPRLSAKSRLRPGNLKRAKP